MEALKTRTIELVGLLGVVFGLGLTVAAAFTLSVIAGMFVLAGLLTFTGFGLLYVAMLREAKAVENGQHARGGPLRAAA